MKKSMLKILVTATAVCTALSCTVLKAEEAKQTLFKNVNVFNGTENKLYDNLNVLVEGGLIKTISADMPDTTGATVIEGNGKTLMPGLIDGHVHLMINNNYSDILPNEDPYDLGIRSVLAVEHFLMDGFTSVRDMGGPAFALARQIKKGVIVGPRIYPSGAFVSQTSGHGDFRDRFDMGWSPRAGSDIGNWEKLGFGAVADGVPEVLKAVRINLRHGATQIKIMAGGGGSSKYDPIDTTQYSEEETCAAVEAAADWGTYVGAHIFTDRAINRGLKCGVKTFEHAFFATEETYAKIGKAGGYVLPQMWGLSPGLLENPNMPKDKLPLVKMLLEKYKDVGRTMLDAGVKVSFTSDWVGTLEDAHKARRFEIYWRTQMFGGGKNNYDGNFEVLKQLTSIAGEMLAMSGPRNPAPGKLGVVEVGATADLILVDGNPLENIGVLNNNATVWYGQPDPHKTPIKTIQIVMKEGVIYKNTL
ncbi:amidohydrolase family protein [Thalassotalea fonticola]|uniref:Amidohydrolase family protein n=1 Tax=Thalassotalea fonticola TaxID=3065649 RepID=A0ABZ0GTA8_9GAMM|nr:amidohydrolase family protein [Colwelliaceae bacterium S1-1]